VVVAWAPGLGTQAESGEIRRRTAGLDTLTEQCGEFLAIAGDG
jgi:hypothetical protein